MIRSILRVIVCAWSHGPFHTRFEGLCGSVTECSRCGESWTGGG